MKKIFLILLCLGFISNAYADTVDRDTKKLQATGSCKYCNLNGTNLSGADLYKANLLGATLVGADLSEANLYRTCLL